MQISWQMSSPTAHSSTSTKRKIIKKNEKKTLPNRKPATVFTLHHRHSTLQIPTRKDQYVRYIHALTVTRSFICVQTETKIAFTGIWALTVYTPLLTLMATFSTLIDICRYIMDWRSITRMKQNTYPYIYMLRYHDSLFHPVQVGNHPCSCIVYHLPGQCNCAHSHH